MLRTAVVHQLQQLYNDVLCHFDQDYITSVVSRVRHRGLMDPGARSPLYTPSFVLTTFRFYPCTFPLLHAS